MKRERVLASDLPEEVLRDLALIERLEQSDRATTVKKLLSRAIGEWKLDYYARQYGERKITMARAAREAGVSLWEMMDYLREHRIAAQYDLDDLRKDMETVLGRIDLTPRQQGD